MGRLLCAHCVRPAPPEAWRESARLVRGQAAHGSIASGLQNASWFGKVCAMDSTLYEAIIKLDAATRFQLAQDLLDSVASETFAGPLMDEQRAELRARLTHHRTHPEEVGVTLVEIKAKLGMA